jgi:hypothetical protein
LRINAERAVAGSVAVDEAAGDCENETFVTVWSFSRGG